MVFDALFTDFWVIPHNNKHFLLFDLTLTWHLLFFHSGGSLEGADLKLTEIIYFFHPHLFTLFCFHSHFLYSKEQLIFWVN